MRRCILVGLALLAGLVAFASPAVAATKNASATVFAVQVILPGGGGSTVGFAEAPPATGSNLGSFAYPADGSIVSSGPSSGIARTGPGSASRAEAAVTVDSVALFGGEITAARVALGASAFASRTSVQGSLQASQVNRLVVHGSSVAGVPNARVSLGEWGYLVVLEQAVQRGDGRERGYRGFVTGLHIYLTADHAGLPAGAEILVGYAEAAALAPSEVHEVDPEPAEPTRDPKPIPPGGDSGPPPIVLDPPTGVKPAITGQGHVFPVYGAASFSDDFGAPRAITGWHHGNDIFARHGAPVLAVADGTLFSVGWNEVGGNRLWLRDRQGNEYYYAHLSAYSPVAANGANVRAGDVIGFVGVTGDARGTPPHLHFEVHPPALLGLGYDGVVNPFQYLSAWYSRRDFDATPLRPRREPSPAAVLLEGTDISSVSGLDPEGLALAYALPLLLPDIARLVRPIPAPLVGAAPGFA
jgi:murein DD-endopeptidase MepM/ murein hydrolase activator NlpD